MSIRHIERSSVPASITFANRFLRQGLAALFVSIALAGSAAASAAGPGDADAAATLTPLNAPQPDTGTIAAAAGQDLTLSAVEKIGDQPVAGQKVKWEVTGPGTADLTPKASTTTSQSATGDAGIASTVFHASAAGAYVVTATAQKNPGCASSGCATWVSTRFDVSVGAGAPAAASSSSSGITKGEIIGAAVVGAAALALAERNNNDNNSTPVVATVTQTIAIVGGNDQSAAVNAPLAHPLQVHLKNNSSNAISIGVQWSATGGAVLSNTTTMSDANGYSQIQVVSVGPGPGPITVTATRSDDSSATVSFTATVIPPAQPSLTIVSGNPQSGFTGTRAPQPLVVQAKLGNAPQANIPIQWTAAGGAIIDTVSNGGVTGADGRSQAIVSFGSTAGSETVTATRMDGTGLSQTFELTATLTNALSIACETCDNQTVPPNRPLPVALRVQAMTNNKVAPGVMINWTTTGGAQPSSQTTVTGQFGYADFKVTDIGSSLGPVYVTATRADDPTASVQFVENIIPPSFKNATGGGQSGLVGTKATTQLQVQLVNGAGAPMGGQVVSWTVLGGASATLKNQTTTTSENGHTSNQFDYSGTPGQFTIRASFGPATQDFLETANAASGLQPISGNNLSGPAGTQIPLVVQVQATGSSTLQGVPIQFSVVSGSASIMGSGSTVTGSNGQAKATVVLGLTPGKVRVLAQVAGGTPNTTFNETVSGNLVNTSLSIVSGNLQVIAPNSPSKYLIVQLKGGTAPLPNQTVTWSATNSAILSASDTTTDPNGQAKVTVTPTISGPITVTANFAAVAQYGAAQPISFSENTTLVTTPTLTTNGQAVGAALDTACASLQNISNRTQQQQDLLNQCLSLSASSSVSTTAAANAINQLTPTVAETQSQTAITATTAQFDNLAARMNALRSGAHGVSLAGLAFDGSNGSLPLDDIGSALMGASDSSKKSDDTSFSRWGLFASGQIGRQDASEQDGTPGYSLASSGITIGVDYRASDSFVLGGAIGYARQITDLDEAAGNLTMNGWSLSGYATWYQKNDWYVDSSITWGDDTFASQRDIDYSLPQPDGSVVTVDQVAQAASGGNDWAGSLDIGRDFHHQAVAYGFYGKLQYDHQSFDGFQEHIDNNLPGSGLALRVDARTNTSVDSVLGTKLDWTHSANWGVWIPHVEAEWEHEFRTDPGTFIASFLDDPTNTPILIKGDQTDSDFFRLGLGMSFVLPQGRSAFVLYDRTIGRQGITEYNLSLGFRIEF